MIGLSRKDAAGGEARRVSMVLSAAEAIGLRAIFQGSLFSLAFHQHLFGSRDRFPNGAALTGER